MISKLEIIKFLLDEVDKELKKGPIYEAEYERAQKLADENNKTTWHYMNYDIKPVNKSKVKNDLKMIRRLTLEIEKEDLLDE